VGQNTAKQGKLQRSHNPRLEEERPKKGKIPQQYVFFFDLSRLQFVSVEGDE